MTTLMKPEDGTLKTSWTRIARLKNVDDEQGWREFYELYRQLILGVAVKAGLRQDEAEEVLQKTMASVANQMAGFKPDPAHGSFRGWLLQNVRWKITDQFRKRLPAGSMSAATSEAATTATTPTVERVPDGQEIDLDSLCDAEWRARLRERALKELQGEVRARDYQIFHLLAVENRSPFDVARMVGINRALVYVVRHRVGRILDKIVKELDRRLG